MDPQAHEFRLRAQAFQKLMGLSKFPCLVRDLGLMLQNPGMPVYRPLGQTLTSQPVLADIVWANLRLLRTPHLQQLMEFLPP